MAVQLDGVDRKILAAMQEDASRSLDDIAAMAGASRTPVWHRIRKLRAAGIIRQNTVLLDPDKLGLEACFFVLIRTSEHQKEWQDRATHHFETKNKQFTARNHWIPLTESSPTYNFT